MPASPIIKSNVVLSRCNSENPHLYDHLEKVIVPDSATGCYWSVWYNLEKVYDFDAHKVTAHLMWCPIGDDPSVNDSWSHAEEINGDCRNVLDTIEAVYGIRFHELMMKELPSE